MASRGSDFAYEFPSTVKSFDDRWLAMCRSSVVLVRGFYSRRAISRVSMVYQAGRFAVIEIHLLSFVKNNANFDKSVGNSAKHALLIFTYLALFFSFGAVVSGLILTYGFGELPVQVSQERDLSQSYRVRRTWVWVMRHWVFSIIAATVSLMTQVLLYLWLEEPNSIRITVSIVMVFVVLPLMHLIPFPLGCGNRHISS
ncbi:hypothetical protein EDB87DRAFT_209974 [Lactarius vividus]|nr:hypothetical protein EDB87DRAFT_209974 [Lactarius vividus]